MINDNTDTRTLPSEVAAHRPHPLGADSQAESERSGSNIHAAADLLAVAATPTEDLPPWLVEEAKAKEVARKAIAAADAATTEKLGRYRDYLNALDTLKVLREQLAYSQALAPAWQDVLDELPATFERSLPQGINVTRNVLLEAALAREAVKLAPKAIEAMKAKVAKAEAEIVSMEKAHGFTRPTATAPVVSAPERDVTVYPTPAFRAPQ